MRVYRITDNDKKRAFDCVLILRLLMSYIYIYIYIYIYMELLVKPEMLTLYIQGVPGGM